MLEYNKKDKKFKNTKYCVFIVLKMVLNTKMFKKFNIFINHIKKRN